MSWKFWKKKEDIPQPWDYFIVVDYSGLAKRMAVGSMRVKKIYHIIDQGTISRRKFYLTPWSKLAFNVEDYDPVAIERYARKKIPIIDATELTSMPVDATKVPIIEQALDMIEWAKRTR